MRSAPRGFTAYVQQDPNEQRNVLIQVTWCAEADEFKKAAGRSFVQKTDAVSFNKRDLPSIMAQAANTCKWEKFIEADYLYLLKYVI